MCCARPRFSALQRAEIAEINRGSSDERRGLRFSALQRAEIAEISYRHCIADWHERVSVLFNEPKLLKYTNGEVFLPRYDGFSALQRAEIAEIIFTGRADIEDYGFQCSSTSRNC